MAAITGILLINLYDGFDIPVFFLKKKNIIRRLLKLNGSEFIFWGSREQQQIFDCIEFKDFFSIFIF